MIISFRKKVKTGNFIEECERASVIIPMYAYEEESNIFFGKDKTLGAVYECSSLGGCDEQLQQRINGFLNAEYPSGMLMQICLFKSPDISKQLNSMLAIRKPYQFVKPFYYNVLKQRVGFLDKYSKENLISSSKRGYFDCNIINDTKIFISFKIQIKHEEPTQEDLIKMRQLQTTIEAGLNSLGMAPKRQTVSEYIRTMQTMVNWNDPSWRFNQTKSFYEEDKPVCEQIFDPTARVQVEEDRLVIGDNCYIKTLSAKRLPESICCGEAISYVGDLMTGNSTIKQNYMVVTNIFFPNVEKEKGKIEKKRQFTTQQAQGNLVKYIPVLKDKDNDFQVMYDSLIKGDKPVRISYHVVLFNKDKESSDYASMTARNIWRERKFEIMEDKCIMLPTFVNCLPLCTDPKAIMPLFRYKTVTTPMAACIIPIFAEWKGTGTFHAALMSRNGQLMSLSLHDSDTNKNLVIAAESGSGKSFLINELIFSYLSEGAQIWVIDAGKSYQKLNETLHGDFLQFDEKTEICLNPFGLISDYTDDEDAVVALVANMASQKNALSELQNASLKRIIGELWQEKGRNLVIDDIAQRCLDDDSDSRIQDIGKQLFSFTTQGGYGRYFNAPNNIKFDNDFTVLELDELSGRKHLRQIILLQLIYQIQQAVYLGNDRNRKKIVIVDEAWDLLKDGDVAVFMEHAYRKFRKYGASICIATQSISDLYDTKTGVAIAQNSASMYLLGQTEEAVERVKNAKQLSMPDYYFNLLKTVRTTAGVYSEIFVKTKNGMGVGRLIVGEYQKLLYSTDPIDVQAIKDLVDNGYSTDEAILRILAQRNLA